MNYYRVRAASKTWSDKGPDLLRQVGNAKRALRGVIDGREDLWTRYRKSGSADWSAWAPGNRAKTLDRFTVWARQNGGDFQVATGGDQKLVAAVKHEQVPFVELAHCSRETSTLWSLVKYQYPKVILSGAFLYRQIEGSSSWSDHAWGTATDNSPRGITNDELFEWQVRMARERCVEVDYILGSQNGQVKVASAPDFDIRPSTASDSHTWHVHTSVVDHDGARPPRNPMFR